ncbi:MAG: NAD-dependent epimerase/dehydratase family protein [Propionibacteriaceae bacterium]
MRRRAFITGVSGFAGRHLAEHLVSAGWSVAGSVRHRSADVPKVAEHRLEIDDVDGIRAVLAEFEPEVVYHLAAVVDTVTTPDVLALYRTNVMGTAAVLEAVGMFSSVRRVLVASSAFAYGRTPPELQPVQESAALEPLTAYGASKVASEAIALQWSRLTGVDVVISRAFQHTGPGHVGNYALADWAGQLASGAPVIRVGNLDVSRDYLDVRDVVAAYYCLAETGQAGGIYNVGSGVPVTMAHLLDGLVEAFGGKARVEVDPARLRTVDQPVFYADIRALVADTAWKPRFTLQETLQDLADFWRSRR